MAIGLSVTKEKATQVLKHIITRYDLQNFQKFDLTIKRK